VPLTWLAAQADPDDLNGDGISGAVVMGQYGEQDIEPRRFGWKGDEPDLAHQISAAFHFDLGLSTAAAARAVGRLHGVRRRTAAQHRKAPTRAASRSRQCRCAGRDLSAFVAGACRVAARVGTDRGRALFAAVGCGACHTSKLPAELVDGQTSGSRPTPTCWRPNMGDGLADRAADDSACQGRRRTRVAHRPLVGPGRSCRSEGRRQPAA
jgi:CxxC motif-containing protein (DUF1111 family)